MSRVIQNGFAVTIPVPGDDNNGMTKKTAATLLTALGLAAAPFAIAPAAHADVCGDVGGRHVSVGGCTPGIVGGVADAAIAGAAVAGVSDAWNDRYGFPGNYAFSEIPSYPGEMPCISPTGIPYYTPGPAPCY